MSILRVTIRSSGPTDYSTEQLRLRLREAVANMEVNEQMEVLENNGRRQRRAADSVQLTRRSHPVPPPLLPVRRRSSSSSSADSNNNNINLSPVSSSSHHSQISPKTQYPSAVTSVRKKKTLPLLSQHSAPAPARVPTCSGAMVTVPKKKDVQLPVLTSYRNGEAAARRRRRRPGTDSVDDDGDDGEYCIRRSRRETRTGNDWEVTRKNHYSYWPPKTKTTTATKKRGFIS
ncbi:hypothetical protein SMMN14_04184 [Sphaerulina musiva]